MNGFSFKRLFDVLVSCTALVVFSPLLLGSMFAVWLQDLKNPFYVAKRVARGGGDFNMIKLRSMVVDAEKTGVNSTGVNDVRITKVGHFIRRYKVDELSQFVNVLRGDMSVVGPRPNTRSWGVDLYTDVEKDLLKVRPGITDLSSIVFSDEGDILRDERYPDEAYNVLIRPWKSRLGLLYVANQSLSLDLRIIFLTILSVVNKRRAIDGVCRILAGLNAPEELCDVCRRDKKLSPATPPGA